MVWRDDEVRWFEADQDVTSCKLGYLGLFILVVFVLLVVF